MPPPFQNFPASSTPSPWPTGFIINLTVALTDPPSTATHVQTLPDPNWYMDTGASSHMTSEQGFLSTVFSFRSYSPEHIVVGNGSLLPIASIGHTTLPHTHFHLNHTLLAPSLIKNLVHVRKFTKDNNCSVEFDPFDFSVKDLRTRAEILRSNSSGDLYHVLPTSIAPSAPLGLTTHSVAPSSTWHRRLGHPGDHVLQVLVNRNFISCTRVRGDPLCNACQLGKQSHLPFTGSLSRSKFPFQIVFADIWTSPVLSFSGYKYFLILLDDFSHFIWTFPLVSKYDVSDTLTNFFGFVKNQFHTSIKIFQSAG